MSTEAARRRQGARARRGALVAIALWLAPQAQARAGEVDFLDLPFGARRATIDALSAGEVSARGGRSYYARREKGMRFADVPLYEVRYGFAQERLVVVEARTFTAAPIDDHCFDNPHAKPIREKMRSLFGPRVRHVGDYSSSAEEFRSNRADFQECQKAFSNQSKVSCEVDVFEKWPDDAGDTDRAVDAALNEVSLGRPIRQCVVRLVFRPGRSVAEKRADEEERQRRADEIRDLFSGDE